MQNGRLERSSVMTRCAAYHAVNVSAVCGVTRTPAIEGVVREAVKPGAERLAAELYRFSRPPLMARMAFAASHVRSLSGAPP